MRPRKPILSATACAIAVIATPLTTLALERNSDTYSSSVVAFSAYYCAKEFFAPGNAKLSQEFKSNWLKAFKLGTKSYLDALKNKSFEKDVANWIGNDPRKSCEERYKQLWRVFLKSRMTPEGESAKNSSAHEKCLGAKDYEGCVNVHSRENSINQESDACDKRGWCTAQVPGLDIFGMKKPLKWRYNEGEDGMRIFYYDPEVRRVPHKNQNSRYIAVKNIVRYYQGPRSGTSGRLIGGGTSSTNCVDYGGSISCSTSQSPAIFIPGRSASAGGVQSQRIVRVLDCKDKTIGLYSVPVQWTSGKLLGKWEKIKESSIDADFLAYCPKADTLPIMNMKL